MSFDFPSYFRFIYLLLFRAKRSHVRLSPRRAVVVLAVFLIIPFVEAVNAIFMGLDRILFPGFRKIEIDRPIFIVGPHRTGTTLLHRVLAKDDQFFSFQLWEMLFPSITQKKMLRAFGGLDRLLGGPIAKLIARREARTFGGRHATIHKQSLFAIAEDDKVLSHIFAMPALAWMMPTGEMDWLLYLDERASERNKKRLMRFYRACIQRQAYYKGGQRRFVSKSPWNSLRIDTLRRYFPGCRFIYTVRNPIDSVPSMLSFAKHVWRNVIREGDNFPYTERAYEIAREMVTYPLSRFALADHSSVILIRYEDLASDLARTIQSIYERFGLLESCEFARALEREDERQRHYHSSHSYALEQFGLTHERILGDFQSVFERFDFDRRMADDRNECAAAEI